MKKVFFFLAFLLFLVVSCSNQNENEPNKQNEQGDSSSSALSAVISSSSSAMPSSSDAEILSSSDVATPSSSDAEMPSSSDVATPSSSAAATLSSSSRATASSSSRATASSSAGATPSSSSSSRQSTPSGGLRCADPVSTTATDYSNMNNWSKFTPPDKLTKDVDIFLLYPTSITGNAAEDCPYANINNSSMRRAVDQWYSGLGKVVTEHVNPYLPYYRQANVFGQCPSGSGQANMTGGAAMEDVIAAFQYYLDHINKGQRPFMMLGFSQGSSPLWELAENRLEKICGAEFGAANRKNHIVTYATGIPGHGKIAANKPVKFSESFDDINVITAWNPYEESDTLCTSSQLGVHGTNGAPTTNPITWTIDENYHEMTENPKLDQKTILGARSYNKLGILLVRKAKDPATTCKSSGNMYMGLHGQDISLFSASIIQNMKDRIEAWNEKYK